MRKGDNLRLQGKAGKDVSVCQAFKGHQESGGSLSQGQLRLLQPFWLLTGC